MKSITYTATIGSDRTTTIALPEDIEPGVYTLRVYVEGQPQQPREHFLQGLPTVRAWDRLKDVSLRREELYRDEGQ